MKANGNSGFDTGKQRVAKNIFLFTLFFCCLHIKCCMDQILLMTILSLSTFALMLLGYLNPCYQHLKNLTRFTEIQYKQCSYCQYHNIQLGAGAYPNSTGLGWTGHRRERGHFVLSDVVIRTFTYLFYCALIQPDSGRDLQPPSHEQCQDKIQRLAY